MKLKNGMKMWTRETPAMGGFGPVMSEQIVICKNTTVGKDANWYIVRFADGGELTMHRDSITYGMAN
jgi:hypothetical protein